MGTLFSFMIIAMLLLVGGAFATTPTVTSAKVTGATQLTVVYNTPVNSVAGDYTNFTGGLASCTSDSVSGSTNDTIVITLGTCSLATNATGTMNIGSGVTSVDTSTALAAVSGQSVTDGQAPTYTVTSVSPASGTTVKVGDSVVVTLTAGNLENNLAYTFIPMVNVKTVGFANLGNGNYNLTYTVVENDTDVLDSENISAMIQLKDTANNAGTIITSIDSIVAPGIDANSPTFTANRTALNTIVLTFSENVDVTTTDGSGYTVAGATVTANTDPAGTGNNITLTTTGLTATNGTPAVTYATASGTTLDVAGNEVSNGFSANAADHVAPTATVTINDTQLSDGETATMTIVFSETITNFDNLASGGFDDIHIIQGGSLSDFTNTVGTTWTSTFTPTDNIESMALITQLDMSAIQDSVGNSGIGTVDSNAYDVDTLEPTFTANRTGANTIVVTFSENVDADAADEINAWAISGATSVTGVTDPAGTNTLTITTTGFQDDDTSSTPTVTYDASQGTVVDTAGNEVADGFNVVATDGMAPMITDFLYEDYNHDGMIDTINVHFSENVVADSFLSANDLAFTNVGDFTGAAFGSDMTDLISVQENNVDIPLGTNATAIDTAENSGNIAIKSQYFFSLKDVAGNINSASVNQGQARFDDGADPIFSAERTDVNTIVLTFSENVNASNNNITTWALSQGSVSSITQPLNETTLTITTSGITGTQATPTVTYQGNGIVRDEADNEVASGQSAIASDGVAPTYTVTSVSPASGTTVKVGDSVVVTLTAGNLENNLAYTFVPMVNVKTVGFANLGNGNYNLTYTVVENDTDVLDSENISAMIQLKDTANNTGTIITSIDSTVAPGIDANSPVISTPGTITLTNDVNGDGIASIGDTITYAAGSVSTPDSDIWTVDLSPYGLNATALPGNYTIVADDDNNVGFNPTETVTDDAGNIDTGSVTLFGFVFIDNVAPTYSVTVTSPINGNTVKIGDTVEVDLTASGAETGLTVASTPTVNGVASVFNETGSGHYTLTYTVVENDTDVIDSENLSVNISLKDTASNVGNTITSIFSGTAPGIDAHKPVITINVLSTSDTTPVLTGTVDQANTAIVITVNGQTPAITNNGDGTWTSAPLSPALALGSYDVTVTSATDAAGNVMATSTLVDGLNIADTTYAFYRKLTQNPRYGTLISNYELSGVTGWNSFTLANLLNSSEGILSQKLTTDDVNTMYVYDGSSWTTVTATSTPSWNVWDFSSHDSGFIGYYVFDLKTSAIGKYIKHN